MLDEDLVVLPRRNVAWSGHATFCTCWDPVASSVVNVASCFDVLACYAACVGLWLVQLVDLVLGMAAVEADMFDLCLHLDACMDRA